MHRFSSAPRGLRGLDVSPALASRAGPEIFEVESEHRLLHVLRNRFHVDVGDQRLGDDLRLGQELLVSLEDCLEHVRLGKISERMVGR